MKRAILFTIMLVMMSLTGCLVSSLHPFFKPADKIFDQAMVGNWIDGDECIWTIQPNEYSTSFMGPSRLDSSYQITYYEEDDKIGHFVGTLFRIKGVDYVDFYPDPNEDHSSSDLTSIHHFPTHTLARVQYSRDSILIYWFGEEWLNDLFEQNRIRIKHETVEIYADYSSHLLTASTEELQKFIKKYANNPKTTDEIKKIFARGYTDDQEDYGIFLKLKPYHGEIPGSKAVQVKPD